MTANRSPKPRAAQMLAEGRHPLTRGPLHAEAPPVHDRDAPGRRCGNCLYRRPLKEGTARTPRCVREGVQSARTERFGALAWWPGCAEHQWEAAAGTVPIEEVVVGDRMRIDPGDLRGLMASIEEIGLLQPIVITRDMALISGYRRLEACRRLGWTSVGAVAVEYITDAVDTLAAERFENTCRAAMVVSEQLVIGALVEQLERPETVPQQGARIGRRRETAEFAAEALGLSRGLYYSAKAVLRFANDHTGAAPVREAARDALRAMDATGQITRAYGDFKENVKALTDPPAAAEHRDARVRQPRRDQRAAITSGLATLTGLCHGFRSVDAIDPATTPDEAVQWERDLTDALRVLRGLHRKVKGHLDAKP